MSRTKRWKSSVGFLVVGLLAGAMVSIGGIASGSASSIQTCTKGTAIKLLKAGHSCPKKDTKVQYDNDGVVQSELNAANGSLSTASKYADIMQLALGNTSTYNYTGLNLNGAFLPPLGEPNLFHGTMGGEFAGDSFEGAFLTGSEFSDFTGADFNGATFVDGNGDQFVGFFTLSTFDRADFSNADLDGATFDGSSFVGAIWDNTICPSGNNSDDEGGSCANQGI